jgi:hypothetical protein
MFQTITVAALSLAVLLAGSAQAQSAIQIEPFPATSYSPKSQIMVTTVRNYYGRCGAATVQVLGVERQEKTYFTSDGVATIVVIGAGGRPSLDLKDAVSDYTGVACVRNGIKKYLLIWSNCSGSACGDDFNFTVVDTQPVVEVAGGRDACNAQCAFGITKSRLPFLLNRHKD